MYPNKPTTQAQSEELVRLNREYGSGKMTYQDFVLKKMELFKNDKEAQKQKYDLKLAQTRAQEMRKEIKSDQKKKGKDLPVASRKRSM